MSKLYDIFQIDVGETGKCYKVHGLKDVLDELKTAPVGKAHRVTRLRMTREQIEKDPEFMGFLDHDDAAKETWWGNGPK